MKVIKKTSKRSSSGAIIYRCQCDCGSIVDLRVDKIDTQKFCKKCKPITGAAGKSIHGHASARTATYGTWRAMTKRCRDPKHERYERYGGRGIKVCKRWRKSFIHFLTDMGERPDGKTIDRIDNDGNYEPSNCRWTTPTAQANNRSVVR